MGKSALGLACLAIGLFGLSGCTNFSEFVKNGFKVGPNYHEPGPKLPNNWIDEDHPKVLKGNPHLADWWEVFDDPVMTNLVQHAYVDNLTLQQARLQIGVSEIQQQVARSELLPQGQSLVASASHGIVSGNNGVLPVGGPAFGTALAPSVGAKPLAVASTPIAGASALPVGAAGTTTTNTSPLLNSSIGAGGAGVGIPVGPTRYFNNFGTSMNLAWELDFWGLFRRNLEASNAALDQSRQNYDELMVLQFSNVATQYIQLRTLQKQIDVAQENIRLQEPFVAKLKALYDNGAANSKPAYFQIKSTLDNTRALIPPLQASLRQTNNQLCNLLGIPVRDLLAELGDGRVPDPKDAKNRIVRIPRPKDDRVVLGIPGDLLLRRPDVQAQERQLRIQSAQIGIAEAQMFPHIGINGTIGLSANKASQVFNSQSWIGSFGPSMTWNIMNYGRLLANVRSQDLQYQQYVRVYQQAILNANQDVENALVAYLQSIEQRDLLQTSAQDAIEVTDYYLAQLNAGYSPPAASSLAFYNQIFTAITFRSQQQQAAAQAEGNVALNLILLYRALGGGWQIRLSNEPCNDPVQPPVNPPFSAPPPRTLPNVNAAPAPATSAVATLGAPENTR
ncbi:MAG TPA: TolC family protein [Gemmataceae bacterium]|nr:TolC family protein [Gemmataceae bacterium]